MPLTKQDLQQIKEVIIEVVEPRFKQHDARFDKLELKIEDEIEGLARTTSKQFDQVFDQLADIKEDVAVIKDIVKDHSFRIARLEHRTAQ